MLSASNSAALSRRDLCAFRLPTIHLVSHPSMVEMNLTFGTKRKREYDDIDKREANVNGEEDQGSEDAAAIDWSTTIADLPPKRRQISRLIGIRLPEMVFPKSQYAGWQPPLPITHEKDVLVEFLVMMSALWPGNADTG